MKHVFEVNTKLRRVLCTLLVATMVLGMIPFTAPKAAAIGAGDTLYFKPNSDMKNGGAWFVAHFYNGSSGNIQVKMNGPDSNGLYSCTIPNGGYSSVIFMRKDPSVTDTSWNSGVWNESIGCTIPTDGKNCFEGTGWINQDNKSKMNGQWITVSGSTNPPASNVTAYLAGSWTDWATNKITMTGTDGNNASVTVQLAAGTYTFKIIDSNNGWHGNGGTINDKTDTGWVMNSDSNCTLNASGGSYTFTYNVTTNTLTVSYSSTGGGSGTVGDVVDLNSGTFTKDPNKLYVNTTFYDYYSDWELDGKNLDSRHQFSVGWDGWYIFNKFNTALSSYYQTNSAKVPIYAGHFQPEWDDWGYRFVDLPGRPSLFGFKDGKAYNTTSTDQKWFMSVNNSTMNVDNPATGGHYSSAAWGIVNSSLVNNNVQAAGSSAVLPFFNEGFLNGTNSLSKKIGHVYHDVQFPFSKVDLNGNGIQYWVFDSEDTVLEMKKDGDSYFLDDITATATGMFKNMNSEGAVQDKYGFFPFNEGASSSNVNTYNYGFGTRIDIDFNLTYDGKLADKYGEKQDIIFKFSGDDDVWVFIDGKLVLDIGGSHGRVDGEINFATKTSTVSSVKTSGGNHTASGTNKTTSFTLNGEMTDEHTLTMFYMERGMWESNMSIAFNFIPKEALAAPTTNVKATKAWNVADGVTLPANIKLQLQHRVGVSGWENVGNPATVTGTGNEWYYTFEGVDKYADVSRTQAYEFRVVELDSDNSVLENGESNSSGMIVTYGDVFGNGATGYEQVITNHKLADSVVVIDFGLSVDISVDKAITSSVNGTLIGVGDPSKLPIGTSVTFKDSDLVTTGDYVGAHGKASIVDGKIRYTPTDMKMDKAELVGYALQYTSGGTTYYYYSTVTIIPAANIYYEDSFLSFSPSDKAYVKTTDSDGNPLKDKNGNTITVNCGVWSAEVAQNGVQMEDRPGTGNALPDADNVYGYDPAYKNYAEYSFGATRWVVVDEISGAADVAPVASFSFTGTGFDVVSVTDNKSGAVWVEVLDKDNNRVMSYIVNNYYGMKYENGQWTVVDNDEACLYQVPVIKVENLGYATYTVNIRATYLAFMDVENKGYYTYYMDAIRIYNPAQNDPTSKDAYDKDGESNPHLTTIKNLILAANTFDNGNTTANGIVFIDGKETTGVKIADYAHQGPNNETYLVNDNGIAFKLKYTGSTKPTSTTLGLQIGAKLADGSSATLMVNGTTVATLTTATNMFYKLPNISWSGTSGNYVSQPIIITCSNVGDSILSLTDLKITGSQANKVTAVSAASGASTNAVATDEDAQILAVFDMGVYEAAVNVMSSGTDVEDPIDPTEPETDPTEPETDPTDPEETDPTEPEETDPTEPEETDPTEPEETDPTEPEETDPTDPEETDPTDPEETDPTEPETEPTEPEVTVPETTAPQKDPDNAQTGDDFGQNLPVFVAAAFMSLLAVLCMAAYASRRAERD